MHDAHDKKMQERATGAIALRSTGSAQGAYFFLSPTTMQILNRQSFTPFPPPKYVINGVHRLARCNPRGLDIRDRDRHLFLEDEYGSRDNPDDSTYVSSDGEDSKNGDESDNNNHNEDIHPPSDREMAHRLAGVIDHSDIQRNTGVHHNEMHNIGVHTETENAGCKKTQTRHIMTIMTLKMTP